MMNYEEVRYTLRLMEGPPPHPSDEDAGHDAKDVEANADLAAFSYFWIMAVLVYFAKRDSAFVRFHARQAVILFVLSVLFWFVPLLGQLLELLILAGMVFGFLNAAQGKWSDVPFIGPLSRREKGIRETWRDAVEMIRRLMHRP